MESESKSVKRFLKSSGILFLLFLGINQFQFFFTPPFYGNPAFEQKFNYFSSTTQGYNTVFFGSSLTFRQINPQQFDSTLKDLGIKSFNCGAPGISNPEQYYLYEKFLENPTSGIHYAFMELRPISSISGINLWTTRNYYWHSPSWLLYIYNYLIHSDLPLKHKIGFGVTYSFTSLIKYTHIGTLDLSPEHVEHPEELIGYNHDGFLSLDDQLKLTPGNDDYHKRKREFAADTILLQQRINQSILDFGKTDYQNWLNRAHLTKTNQLISDSQAKGIHLIFIIPPMLPEYREVLALKEALPENHVIELADINKYPEFYLRENLFDHGHLNAVGASLFTGELGDELRLIISKNK